jgi:hypothetical protein
MDIGTILSDSWAIVRRHKALWLFGFLASLGSSVGTGLNFSGGDGDGAGAGDSAARWLSQIPSQQLALIVGILCVMFVALFLFLLILSTMGQAGLIQGAAQADSGAVQLPVRQLWSDTAPYFWPMLLFNIAILVLIVAAGVGLAMLFFLLAITIVGLLCLIPLLCLLLPVAIVGSWWVELARVALVVDGVDLFEAFRRGWVLMRSRLSDVLVLGIVTFLISVGATILLLLPALVLLAPIGIAMALSNDGGGAGWLFLALAGFCLLLPFAIVVGSLVKAYVSTAWTLLYRRMSGFQLPGDLPPPSPVDPPYPMTAV